MVVKVPRRGWCYTIFNEMDARLIGRYLSQTEVLRAPRRALATFGATNIRYHLISPVEDMAEKTRLRQGTVVSERPKILTADAFRERFQGFGEGADEFASWLSSKYRDLLRALEYNFRNSGFTASVISDRPREVAARVLAGLAEDEAAAAAVIRCPDGAWSLALMKLTLDESARSFPIHVRDLERRGLFDPAAAAGDRRRREIEALFSEVASDPAARQALGRKLHEYGLFDEYQDRFLSLF